MALSSLFTGDGEGGWARRVAEHGIDIILGGLFGIYSTHIYVAGIKCEAIEASQWQYYIFQGQHHYT